MVSIPIIGECKDSIFVTVLSTQYGSTAGCADGIRAEDVFKKNAFVGQSVNICGGGNFFQVAAVAANRLPGMVVRHDENDVRFGCGALRETGRGSDARANL